MAANIFKSCYLCAACNYDCDVHKNLTQNIAVSRCESPVTGQVTSTYRGRRLFDMELEIYSPTHGWFTVLYDEDDAELIAKYKWYICLQNKIYYCKSSCGKTYLHWLVMKGQKWIDHISGNGLDCRKSNLRLATRAQNCQNRKTPSTNKTGFKGVKVCRRGDGYSVTIKVKGRVIYGGVCSNLYVAALKYNELALLYFGEFARLNVLTPEQIEESKKIMPNRIRSTNTSGFRGVCPIKNSKYYKATIRGNGKNVILGTFETPEEAARAYDSGVIFYNKPLSWLNFPHEHQQKSA